MRSFAICTLWRKLHNEELRDLYSLPNIIRIIKLRWMRWVEHGAQMGEKRRVYKLLAGKPDGERDCYKDQNIGGWIILG
jgi:hypothetical protein